MPTTNLAECQASATGRNRHMRTVLPRELRIWDQKPRPWARNAGQPQKEWPTVRSVRLPGDTTLPLRGQELPRRRWSRIETKAEVCLACQMERKGERPKRPWQWWQPQLQRQGATYVCGEVGLLAPRQHP